MVLWRRPGSARSGLDGERRRLWADPLYGASARMRLIDCAFCGERLPRSKEHVWPAWLQQHFGTLKTNFRGAHEAFSRRISEQIQSGNTTVLGDVCVQCNTGWMRELENAAAPILLARVDHAPILFDDISTNDLATLSRWSYKTAIVINAASNYRRIVPDGHFRSFHSSGAIPGNTWIDLSVLPTSASLAWDQSQFVSGIVVPGDEARFRESQAHSYNVVLGIGTLLIRVFHNPISDLELNATIAEGDLLRIHPAPPVGTRRLETGPSSLASFAHAAFLEDARLRAV